MVSYRFCAKKGKRDIGSGGVNPDQVSGGKTQVHFEEFGFIGCQRGIVIQIVPGGVDFSEWCNRHAKCCGGGRGVADKKLMGVRPGTRRNCLEYSQGCCCWQALGEKFRDLHDCQWLGAKGGKRGILEQEAAEIAES